MLLPKLAKSVTYFGSAALLFSSQALQAKDLVACHDCHMKRLPKVKELPIYDQKDNYFIEYDEKSALPLISEITAVRKKVFQYASYINMFQEQAVHIYETGVAHSKSSFEYLKDEENKLQRVLIIASGGLVGFLLSRKGGIIRKILYTTGGTGVVFSIFYPAISKEFALAGWNSAKLHINHALTNYGGYDTDKISEEAHAKIDYIKSAMKFEGIMSKLNEIFYKKDKLSVEKEGQDKETSQVNQDMYTTRTAT